MAKKRTAKRRASNRKSNNSFVVVGLVIIVLALIAFIITYFIMSDEKVDKDVLSQTETQEIVKKDGKSVDKENDLNISELLEGTWVSNNDGAMLTIKGRDFTIELPSVDNPEKTNGKVVYTKANITFVNTDKDNDCGIKPGEYEFIMRNGEVTFIVVKDDCKSRVTQMSSSWFKL